LSSALTPAQVPVRLLLALAVVIVVVQLLGWIFARLHQPRVLGELVAAILLGPSLLGLLAPVVEGYVFPEPVVSALRSIAELGLVLFMMIIGLEFDASTLRGSGRTVLAVGTASVLLPFVLAIGFAAAVRPVLAPASDAVGFAVFMGAAMAVTAFPVLARILTDAGLHNARIGRISLLCAAFNDVTAWLLVGVAAAVGADQPSGVLRTALLTVAFLTVMLLIVRPLLARFGPPPGWLVLVVAALSAWTTEQIGVHAIIGGFVAGVAMPRHPQWQRRLHDRLDLVVSTLLLPVFFIVVGLSTHIADLSSVGWWVALSAIAVATLGKSGGSVLAARAVGESWRDSATLGALMNTKGVTEIVILTVGRDLGIINDPTFTVMVIMTLATTLLPPPALALLRRGSEYSRDGTPGRGPDGDKRPCLGRTGTERPGTEPGGFPRQRAVIRFPSRPGRHLD
jgi:Kef-type K+ transport system membrane component KefB